MMMASYLQLHAWHSGIRRQRISHSVEKVHIKLKHNSSRPDLGIPAEVSSLSEQRQNNIQKQTFTLRGLLQGLIIWVKCVALQLGLQ